MSTRESRWFPGHSNVAQRFVYGWQLTGGQRWDAEDCAGEVALNRVSFVPARALEIDLVVDTQSCYRFTFADVVDIQIDGSVHLGETNQGWAVLGTAMLEANHRRTDGRLVYVVELADALVCFASRLAMLTVQGD